MATNNAANTDATVTAQQVVQHSRYKGFMAGVFSGVVKLTVGHPFDTIKVRMQTAPADRFKGSWDCFIQTIRGEGVRGLLKGASPPLVGWMFMDSIMLGSLSNYRQILLELDSPYLSSSSAPLRDNPDFHLPHDPTPQLNAFGHGVAGVFAGGTVSFVAAPIEHIKARLQIQYQSKHAARYTGPIDCARQIVSQNSVFKLWHGLSATLIFRSFFFFWWSSYHIFTKILKKRTNMSTPAINFWAGGCSAQVFWMTCYPADVVKQRIMTDELGVGRKYPSWVSAAKAVYRERGVPGFYRGFMPTILRAFPANAAALAAFEFAMRNLPDV